jgi:hypothetical protein
MQGRGRRGEGIRHGIEGARKSDAGYAAIVRILAKDACERGRQVLRNFRWHIPGDLL